jgi:hypothetical protein
MPANRLSNCRSVMIGLVGALVVLLACAAAASADETVDSCGLADAGAQNKIFRYVSVYGINPSSQCGLTGFGVLTTTANVVPSGRAGGWVTTAPAGLAIAAVNVPAGALDVYGAAGTGYVAEFYWDSGSTRIGNGFNGQFGWGGLSSSSLGFQIRCAATTCNAISDLQVNDIALQVHETPGPWLIAPDGLWQASGWVRQDWTLHFYGDSPSGLCSLSASVNGQPVPGGSGSTQDPTWWHQCAAGPYSQTVHTPDFGQGPVALTIRGTDAAGVSTPDPGYTKTVYIDNSQPTVSLSGPTDAPSTAGVQYITAAGGGSPSGIDGLDCAVDSAPARWYPGASAQVPVSGIGQHTVKCAAADNAVDQAGNHGWSSWTTWNLSIRQPTTAALSFGSRILDALQCRRVSERVKIPAMWVTVRRHGTPVNVKRRAQTKVVKVVRCHPRVVRARVRVKVNGRWEWRSERQVRLPRTVQRSTWRARYGATAKVVGWLGTTAGVALAGQTVRILTATDNGLNTFTPAAVAITGQDGVWSATLPAGPSRLVEALYDGGNTIEPASSGQVRLTVPALVKLTITPRRTHWWRSPRSPGTIKISGRVLGGYIPGADQQLLRLRIGVIGTPGVQSTIGIPDIAPDGRFHTTWTPAPGNGTVHFWFSVSTLHEADYPFAPASSAKVAVIVK